MRAVEDGCAAARGPAGDREFGARDPFDVVGDEGDVAVAARSENLGRGEIDVDRVTDGRSEVITAEVLVGCDEMHG